MAGFTLESVAAFRRKGVADLRRNQWPAWVGIRTGRFFEHSEE